MENVAEPRRVCGRVDWLQARGKEHHEGSAPSIVFAAVLAVISVGFLACREFVSVDQIKSETGDRAILFWPPFRGRQDARCHICGLGQKNRNAEQHQEYLWLLVADGKAHKEIFSFAKPR